MSKRILMVCLGNICRSPLAEGIFDHHLAQKGLEIDSAGTSGHHQGEKPDQTSVATAQKFGIDIADQRSRPFQFSDFDTFDYIFVMDKSNLRNIMTIARSEEDKKKVSLIMDLTERKGEEVPDPYYGGDHGFDQVFYMLDDACKAFIKKNNI